jgi:TM2 domain-containing membrane protein YozV
MEKYVITGINILSKNSLLVFLLLLAFASNGQNAAANEFGFIQHLYQLEEWDEGLLAIDMLQSQPLSPGAQDSANYYKGFFHYKQKQIEPSIAAFSKLAKPHQSFYTQSLFLRGFQEAYSGDLPQASSTLSSYSPSDSLMIGLKHLQLAGLSLLNRNEESYSSHKNRIGDFYQLKPYAASLEKQHEKLHSFKGKSPFLAGLMSAIVPGAGRFYIGKGGEGIATLLVTGVFGLQTWEGYRKDGIKSARFIIFGSLFSLSYVANIWGSTLAVKVRKDEFNEQINDSVLLDMHIPIRVLFN